MAASNPFFLDLVESDKYILHLPYVVVLWNQFIDTFNGVMLPTFGR